MSQSKFALKRVQGAPVSDGDILDDMRRASGLAGTIILSQRLYIEFGTVDASTARRRFGTWNKALSAAGLQIANEQNIPTERLFENILVLWEHYGRQPRQAELLRPPSEISQGPCKRRFASWTAALTQFVEFANTRDRPPPSAGYSEPGRRTSRQADLRMRFRVLKRDNFSCRACGASPALKPGLALHVDHIIAWSAGGETVDENLQALCEPCNLGKGNIL